MIVQGPVFQYDSLVPGFGLRAVLFLLSINSTMVWKLGYEIWIHAIIMISGNHRSSIRNTLFTTTQTRTGLRIASGGDQLKAENSMRYFATIIHL